MKDIFIERQNSLTRIAIRENNKLKECYIEEESKEPYSGQIYMGVIENILPGMKCAFVDIGFEKKAYMYLNKNYGDTFKKGEEVIVEVLKEPISDKGPKVTNAFTIPGRYCVLQPHLKNQILFSKKINNEDFKYRIEKSLKVPNDMGVMIRTNAQQANIEIINNELNCLYKVYERIINESKYILKPKLLFEDRGTIDKILRDKINENVKNIYVNTLEDYNYVKDFLKDLNLNIELILHKDSRNLFKAYSIEKEILNLNNNRVNLKCGGFLIIDKTEAMYVIDVNSGKNIKGNKVGKIAFDTNKEAAKEIAKQIILRNLSGIIVIDFIDLYKYEEKQEIINILKQGFLEDKNKTIIYPFTELNLVQIARRRRGKEINKYIKEKCISCHGSGTHIKFSYLCMLIRNEIYTIDKESGIDNICIKLNVIYKSYIENNKESFIKQINGVSKNIYIQYLENYKDGFKVEPLVFSSQIQNLGKFKIYSKDSLQI